MSILFENWVVKILSSRYLPTWLVLLLDLAIAMFAYVFAQLLLTNFRFDTLWETTHFHDFLLIEVCYGVSFFLYKSYEGAFRHTGLKDLNRLNLAMATALVAIFVISRVQLLIDLEVFQKMSVAFLILHGFTFTMGVMGLRLFVKLLYSLYILNAKNEADVDIMIYGAGSGGMLLLNAIRQDTNSGYRVTGFIDDNSNLVGKRVGGVKVYSSEEALDAEFIAKNNIKELVWSIQNYTGEVFHSVGEICLNNNIKFRKVPNIREWVGGSISSKQLKAVKIEDLLNRSAISLENPSLKEMVSGSVVMVTGAAGSIGSELCRQLLHCNPKQLVMIDNAETPVNDFLLELAKHPNYNKNVVSIIADITRNKRMELVFEQYKPEYVFHAAAYKHVPMMENNAVEAVKVNVEGTWLVAELAVQYGVKKFVMISTDKAVNPTNVMGATKRAAEILVQNMSGKSKTEFITTRFGNVLGSNGSVIPLFTKQIENREDITVTHKDIIRYFMTIPEACQLVFQAATMGKGGEIFVFDVGEPVKIYDLAVKMVKLSGLTLGKDIHIVETGLRPGEKLYEELLSNAENTLPTHNKKILIAKVREYADEEIAPFFSQMRNYLISGSTDLEMVQILKDLIPEYKSQNSIYEKLD